MNFYGTCSGLKDQVSAGFNQPENKAGLTPKKQLNKIAIKAHALMTVQYDTFKIMYYQRLS